MHHVLPRLLGLDKDSKWFLNITASLIWELSEINNVKVIECSFPEIKIKTKHQFSYITTSVIYQITDLIYYLRVYYIRLISAFVT